VRLKLRHRIGLLVALAGVALLVVTAMLLVLGKRSQDELTGIETRYVPLIELDRDLKRIYADVARALEDAAGAGEEGRLADADRLGAEFLDHLARGKHSIIDNGGDPQALDAAFRRYYQLTREVSAALIVGTPSGQLTEAIEAMGAAKQALTTLLDASTSPNRMKLASAFSSARDAQETLLRTEIIVACLALVLMAVISWRTIRGMVRSFAAVSKGVERLARGELTEAIEVPPGDEIADLAHEANRTAERLRAYREDSEAALAEARLQARAAEMANKELEAFSYSVSHDLRAPLRTIDGFSAALVEDDAPNLSPEGKEHVRRIRAGAKRMSDLIDDLLRLSRVSRGELRKEPVDLQMIAMSVVAELRRNQPEREVEVTIADDLAAVADARLVRIILENLIGNAWKFTAKVAAPKIEIGARTEGGERIYFIRDNGAGFDMKYQDQLFGAFQRLHHEKDFSGTGIGLATVHRIVVRHGGRIWATGQVDGGATFELTLPR
jgi:signal transduction histidine kinase